MPLSTMATPTPVWLRLPGAASIRVTPDGTTWLLGGGVGVGVGVGSGADPTVIEIESLPVLPPESVTEVVMVWLPSLRTFEIGIPGQACG